MLGLAWMATATACSWSYLGRIVRRRPAAVRIASALASAGMLRGPLGGTVMTIWVWKVCAAPAASIPPVRGS